MANKRPELGPVVGFDQVRKFTVVVMASVTAIAIFIWLCDVVFGNVMLKIYGTK